MRLSCLLPALAAVLACAPPLEAETLPDAPAPQQQPSVLDQQPPTHPVPATRSNRPAAVEKRQFSVIVEPGEKVPPLSVRDKLLFPVHETTRYTTPLAILWGAWYGVLTDSNPHYGVNLEGWGERAGAAALRQANTHVLSDSLLAIAFKDDPRYYRLGEGSYVRRGEYAVSRVLITQKDDGSHGVNYPKILGRGMAAALTQTYYPQSSINNRYIFTSWATSLATLGASDLFNEFFPDIKQRVFHKK